ncbi:MAG: hypothetical protein ACOCXA_06070, partial [Planctomycetota bacterium]
HTFSRFQELWIEDRLSDIWQQPSVHILPQPGYSLVVDERTSAVSCLREGFTDKMERYHRPTVLWMTAYPNYRLHNDRLLSWHNDSVQVVALPERRQLLHIEHPGERIVAASLQGEEVAYQIGETVHIAGIGKGEPQTSLKLEQRYELQLLTPELVLVERGGQVMALERATGERRWQKRYDRNRLRLIDGQLLAQDNTSLFLIDPKDGSSKKFKLPRRLRNDIWSNGTQLYVEPDLVVDRASGKGRRVERLAVDDLGTGVLLINGGTATWQSLQESEELDIDPGLLKEIGKDDRTEFRAHHRDKVVVLRFGDRVMVVDKSWGMEWDQNLSYARTTNCQAVLHHSLLLSQTSGGRHGGAAVAQRHYLIARQRPASQALVTQAIARLDPDADEWPEQGWLPPQDLPASSWRGRNGHKPLRRYTYQFGSDDSHLYLRLLMHEAEDATVRIASRLTCLASWLHPERDVGAEWDLNASGAPRALPLQNSAVHGWRQRLGPDSSAYHLILPRADMNPQYRSHEHPRLHLHLEERVDGDLQGRYVVGGPILPDMRHLPVPALRQETVLSEASYEALAEVYTEASAFFPQGLDLAAWIRHHRLLHGHASSEAVLQGMLQRTAQADCVANVLSVQLLEAIELLRRDPTTPDVREPGYTQRVQKRIQELDAAAAAAGVSAERRRRGLSTLFLIIDPGSNSEQTVVSGLALNRGHAGMHYSLDTASPFSDTQQRTFGVLLPLGLFTGPAPQQITDVNFHDMERDLSLTGLALLAQDQITWWVHPDGSLRNGFEVPKGSKQLRFSRGSSGVIDMPRQLKLPDFDAGSLDRNLDIPADDLLLALRNLPPDSSIALDVIQAYQQAAGADGIPELELYRIALPRIKERSRSVLALTSHLLRLVEKRYTDERQRYELVGDILREADVPRQTQRLAMLDALDLTREAKTISVLGPFPVEQDLEFLPEPERSADPLQQDFVIDTQSKRFVPARPSDWQDWRRQRETAVGYIAVPFRLDERSKVFCYLDQMRGAVSVWFDGEQVMDGEQVDGLQSIAHRLDAGQHLLLIRQETDSGWQARIHLGDAWGLPLPELHLPSAR